MKTEEYIETIVSAHANMRWMDASELREILNKVTDMGREEEREKAIKALDIAIMAIFERNTHSVSMGELRAQFNKLLNE